MTACKEDRRLRPVEAGPRSSVSVVIPTYDMAWCVERAVASCLAQTHEPEAIVVVDDASTDATCDVVARICESHDLVRYVRLQRNVGHLEAVRVGLSQCDSSWVALLDADDELTSDSLERRIGAAAAHQEASGEWPQLVYGDLYRNRVAPEAMVRFKALEGRVFAFLSRELSLCQTSTIMLGRDAIAGLGEASNPYNTDDEIVLAVGKRFAIVHAGAAVATAHDHAAPTRMTNSAARRLRGIVQLVRNHREEILEEHGAVRLYLWRLRVLRSALECLIEGAAPNGTVADSKSVRRELSLPVRLWGRMLHLLHARLTNWLSTRFEQMYF